MVGYEEIFRKVISSERFWQKMLIGGLLSCFPPFTILAFGYLYGYALQVKKQGRLDLPEWEAWDKLLINGVRFLLLFLLLFIAPLLLASLISWVIQEVSFGLLLPASYLCMSLTAMIVPGLTIWGWLRYEQDNDWQALLNGSALMRDFRRNAMALLVPTLLFWAVIIVGAPLLGFVFFFAFVFFMPYAILIFRKPKSAQS